MKLIEYHPYSEPCVLVDRWWGHDILFASGAYCATRDAAHCRVSYELGGTLAQAIEQLRSYPAVRAANPGLQHRGTPELPSRYWHALWVFVGMYRYSSSYRPGDAEAMLLPEAVDAAIGRMTADDVMRYDRVRQIIAEPPDACRRYNGATHWDDIAPMLAPGVAAEVATRIILRAARRDDRAIAETARTVAPGRIIRLHEQRVAESWERPVAMAISERHGRDMAESVGMDHLMRLSFTGSTGRTSRKDIRCQQYSRRCTFRKIAHILSVQAWCVLHQPTRQLWWVIDTPRGLVAGGRVLRRGQSVPTSTELLGDRTPSKYATTTIARRPARITEQQHTWDTAMLRQSEAARIDRAVARRSRIDPAILMRIDDAHARAEAIEACGGWHRVADALPMIHRTDDGELRDGGDMGVRVLVVRCPSTRKTYGLRVPTTVRTVAGALRWCNGVAPSQIVAHA